jgi:glycosyltransferase involved in cell wall biosynthesis
MAADRDFQTDDPRLSVVIASYNSAGMIENCLASLRGQVTEAEFEVIVVDSSTDGAADGLEARFPGLRLLRFRERKYPGDARNHGVAAARAPIVAFLDADCLAAAHWVERVLRAHDGPDPAIGGSIANAEPAGAAGWASYFCEFSQWMPGGHGRLMEDIAEANMSYKKWVFDNYGEFLTDTYCSDTEFHWRLEAGGVQLRWEPAIEIAHRSIGSAGKFLRHEFHHGQFFARIRCRGRGFRKPKRAIYVLAAPLVFCKVFLGITARNFRNRIYLPKFLKVSPLLALGVGSWCLGECAGYAREIARPATRSAS